MGIYSAIVVFIETNYFPVISKNATVMHSILGFVLSMLLVFRTNSAYDRWWEGRKIWGSAVNNSRNLALKLSVIITDTKSQQELKHLIVNHVFCFKNHLRGKVVVDEFTATDSLNTEAFLLANHKPNRVAKALYAKIQQLYSAKQINNDHLIIMNEELKSFTDNCGACERIKNTPIPYSYNIFLKKMIFLYVISLPIFFSAEFGYITVVIAVIVLYVFASIELIAEEIEDPFGEDDNDLPLNDICNRIKSNLDEILN
jgi:putative membrane protein